MADSEIIQAALDSLARYPQAALDSLARYPQSDIRIPVKLFRAMLEFVNDRRFEPEADTQAFRNVLAEIKNSMRF